MTTTPSSAFPRDAAGHPGDDDGDPTMDRIRDTVERLALGLDGVWTAYVTVGGVAAPVEVDAWLYGALVPDDRERRLLHHGLWELELDGS